MDTLLLQLFPEEEPAEFGQVIKYFFGGTYGLITLTGLIGFFTKCPNCKAWFDPYKFIGSTGPVSAYSRTKKTYQVSEDDEELTDDNFISSKTDFFSTEIHSYECIKCKRVERRKLVTKS